MGLWLAPSVERSQPIARWVDAWPQLLNEQNAARFLPFHEVTAGRFEGHHSGTRLTWEISSASSLTSCRAVGSESAPVSKAVFRPSRE